MINANLKQLNRNLHKSIVFDIEKDNMNIGIMIIDRKELANMKDNPSKIIIE